MWPLITLAVLGQSSMDGSDDRYQNLANMKPEQSETDADVAGSSGEQIWFGPGGIEDHARELMADLFGQYRDQLDKYWEQQTEANVADNEKVLMADPNHYNSDGEDTKSSKGENQAHLLDHFTDLMNMKPEQTSDTDANDAESRKQKMENKGQTGRVDNVGSPNDADNKMEKPSGYRNTETRFAKNAELPSGKDDVDRKSTLGTEQMGQESKSQENAEDNSEQKKKIRSEKKKEQMGQESKSQENAEGIARAARKIENLKAAKERADKHRKRIANRLRAQQYARAKAAGRHGRRWRYNTRRP